MVMGQLNGLEIRHLAALRAVAHEGSFGRAALRLGFSQSAVSQQIAMLERLVGLPLFDRPGGPRPVMITDAGAVLLAHAEAVLDRIDAAESDLEAFQTGETGRVAVGTFQSVSVRILPPIVIELKRERPGAEVHLSEQDDQDVLLAELRSGQLDLSFLVMPVSGDDLDLVPLCDDRWVVLCPPGSPLAPGRGPVDPIELQGLPLVGQQDNGCQRLVERGMLRVGLVPNIVFRSGDNSAVQAMVRAGMGHAVMPFLAIDPDDRAIVIRDLEMTPRRIVLATVKGRTLSPVAQAFRSMAIDYCQAELGPMEVSKAG
jgi:DNA-binding transcriptional LysR family regulator